MLYPWPAKIKYVTFESWWFLWGLLCDDDSLCRQQAVNAIKNVTKSLDVLVDAFDNGYELLKRFNTVKYDLIMLDIEMPTIDGITLAKKIRDLSENVYIVF